MDRMKPDCWVWSPSSPLSLLHPHSGSRVPVLMSHQEVDEDEEEVLEHPVLCCSLGCDDIISHHSNPFVHSGTPSSSGHMSSQSPGAPSSQQPKTVIHPDRGDAAQRFMAGRCWEGPGMETQGCVCVYGQREPGGFGSCWPGSPYVYYGVRRNLVVGVEVVEEVAVEDTLEVITEDVYADDLMDPELLQDDLLYPT
ncbi:uncharacterized protein LKV04_006948 isoform 1-T1 [Tautogolabrus adspersus]